MRNHKKATSLSIRQVCIAFILACLFILLSAFLYRNVIAVKVDTLGPSDSLDAQSLTNSDSKSTTTYPKDIAANVFDGEKARALYKSILASNNALTKKTELRALFNQWVEYDPYDAIRFIQSNSQENVRQELYSFLFSAWANKDSESFNRWINLQKMSSEYDVGLAELVSQQVIPPETRMRWVARIDDLVICQEAHNLVLEDWLLLKPENAVTWALEQSDKGYASRSFEFLVSMDPVKAFELLPLVENESPEVMANICISVTKTMDLHDFNQDIFYAIELLPIGGLQEMLLDMLIPKLINVSPGFVASAIGGLPESDFRTGLEYKVARQLAQTNPALATEFAFKLPAGNAQARAVEAVVLNWQNGDLAAAGNWLAEVEPYVDSERAVTALVSASGTNPSELRIGMYWVDKIQDQQDKVNAIEAMVGSWAEWDLKSAKHYLTTSTYLPRQEAERILSHIDFMASEHEVEEKS